MCVFCGNVLLCVCVLGLFVFFELAMFERKMLRNYSREYWYMGFILVRLDI